MHFFIILIPFITTILLLKLEIIKFFLIKNVSLFFIKEMYMYIKSLKIQCAFFRNITFLPKKTS